MSTASLPSTGLVGRQPESNALQQVVADARDGRSRVLVVRGPAGVGKTALLEQLTAGAADCTIVRAAGVEAEMELPFAGLQALCAPLLGGLHRLPAPQRAALGTAFGLEHGSPPDRFIVGLAVLSLFADAAERRPLLCIVDDVQWLDRGSVQTLAFVGRRLLAERVGLVFGLRAEAGDHDHDLAGLAVLEVGGLATVHARALLDTTIPGPIDERVRERILAEAAGNPLGLLELPRGLTPVAVAGGFGLPDPSALEGRLERGFVAQLDTLPEAARQLLLLAAAEPVGDAHLLRAAAARLGLHADDVATATDSGLVQIGTHVRFRHPLVRSAIYRASSSAARRAAHRALSEAIDAHRDPDRRAWHRAQAAPPLDAAVADELEHSAERARKRGGLAAVAAFLARSAELTPDPARRGARALAAATARFQAGAPGPARELLALAQACPLDALQRARLTRLDAQIRFALTRGADTPPLFLEAARRLEPLDRAAARETYLEALETALIVGRVGGRSGLREAAEAARRAPAPPREQRPSDLLLDGMATRFTDGPVAAAPVLRRACEAFREEPLDDPESIMRWLALCQAVMSMTVFELWDDEGFHALPTRAVHLARGAGALSVLPIGLAYLAGVQMFSGEFAASAASIQESDAIRAATGHVVVGGLGLVAWQAENDAVARINAAYESALERGEGRVVAMAGCCTAILNNGLGRYEAAIEGARRGIEDDDQWYVGWSLAELVEAATRGGEPGLACSALRRLEPRTLAAGTDWSLGVLARCRALVEKDASAEPLYREAIERLDRTRLRIEAARARVLYGEWLRRAHRREDARDPLRSAYETFSRIGARAFAERARRDLVLTGEPVLRHKIATREVLTAQEAQIARMARDGQTNPEIGAHLFISPRTVEYHLRKVFTKLGIGSRKDLKAALATRVPGGAD